MSVRAESIKPYLFILPAFLLFATFSIYPFYLLTVTSLFEWDGISITKQFVGLGNYWSILAHDPVFWTSFWQAGYITLLALTFQNALALALAIAVNRNLTGSGVFRTLFFLPPILRNRRRPDLVLAL